MAPELFGVGPWLNAPDGHQAAVGRRKRSGVTPFRPGGNVWAPKSS